MAYAEALSHGLPVIGTTAGAIPDTVPQGAGLLVTAGDVDCTGGKPCATSSLTPSCAAACPTRQSAAARTLPTWQQSGAIFAAALEKLA